jgi:hypothetical protein
MKRLSSGVISGCVRGLEVGGMRGVRGVVGKGMSRTSQHHWHYNPTTWTSLTTNLFHTLLKLLEEFGAITPLLLEKSIKGRIKHFKIFSETLMMR